MGELEAVSSPSFGRAYAHVVQVLLVQANEGGGNDRAFSLFRNRTAFGKAGTHVSLVY